MQEALEQDKCTFRIFIDLSKAFDNVDLHKFLRELEPYDMNENKLKRFKRYLGKRVQCIQIAKFQKISFSVFEVWCLGQVLFGTIIIFDWCLWFENHFEGARLHYRGQQKFFFVVGSQIC